LFTYEGLKLQSIDGSGIDLDNYLYFNDASATPIIPSICASPGLSSDGLLLLTRDNTADFINYCDSPEASPSTTTTTTQPPPPAPPPPAPPPPPPPPEPSPIYSHVGTNCAASAATVYTFVSTFNIADFAYSDVNATVPYTGYFVYDGETYYYSDGYGSASTCPSSLGTLTFTAVDGGGFGDINWTSATNAVSYSVYRSEDSVDYYEIFSGSANTYEDYGILGGGNYYWYNVAAFSGASSFSSSPQIVYFP
jgi:hypothetical protein